MTEYDPGGPQVSMTDMSLPTDGPTDHQQVSYFGVNETHRCFFPDDVSYVEHKTMAEGERKWYQNETNREVTFKRSTGDASMKMKPGDERHLLLQKAIVGWNLVDVNLQPVVFNPANLRAWLEVADPKVVDLVETDIRKHNGWLMADLPLEELERQRDQLSDMIEVKRKEEAGKVS